MAILNGSVRPPSGIHGTVAVLALTFGTLVVAAAAPRETQREASVHRLEDLRQAPREMRFEDWRATLEEMRAAVDQFKKIADEVPQSIRAAADCAAGHQGESFAGTTNTTRRGVVDSQIGTLNGTHRIAVFTLDGIRVCMVAENVGPATEQPSRWIDRATHVVMESAVAGKSLRLVVDRGQSPTWQVNGVARPVDAAANEWRDRILAVLDARWELTTLHGQATSLRGEITSIRGEETSLRGQITSLRGHVTSMQGQITSLRGHETSLRGQITSIRGHETSLRGQITSAQGVITSLNTPGYPASDASRRIAEQAQRIEQIEREIQKYNADAKVAAIEKEIDKFEVERKVAEVLKQIDDFDVERKIEDVERRIADLKVGAKEQDLEKQIDSLDVQRRAAEIEHRIEAESARLKAAVAAIR